MQESWPTVNEAVNFLRKHGHQETLKSWAIGDFYSAFCKRGRVFAWSRNQSNELTGVVIGTITGSTIYIDTIALRGEPISTFVSKFRREYPGFKLTGHRRGKLKRFKRYECRITNIGTGISS